MDKQLRIEAKTGPCQDDNISDQAGVKQHSETIVKDGELPSGRAGEKNRLVLSNSFSFMNLSWTFNVYTKISQVYRTSSRL